MTLLANQRRNKILELLREDGSAKVANLARIFKVSEVTIRQDLERLEGEGYLTREHGGAYLKQVEDQVRNFSLLNQDNLEKKALIGNKAASLIQSGEVRI
jgi:DeoR/GlpR family transcriptional regulator of sugar metabolism